MSTTISMIAALDEEHAIGKDNDLPWHLPDDFKWFKERTSGHPVIMGRKTMQALGKPLKNRLNIVLSRNKDSIMEGFSHADSIENALELAGKEENDEIFVIGGAEIYRQFLQISNRLYLTHVHTVMDGTDAYFPKFDRSNWRVTARNHHPVDDRHKYSFDITTYDKL